MVKDIAPNVPDEIISDPIRLEQVLINLISSCSET